MISRQNTRRGFALPTILIVSVIMMIVLLSSVSASSSIRSAMDAQYYDQLAREAGESAVNYAVSCVKSNNNTAPWKDNNKILTPAVGCDGTTSSGVPYLNQSPLVRMTFRVDNTTIDAGSLTIEATGIVQLIRSTDQTVSRTYVKSTRYFASLETFNATVSSSGRSQVCGIINAEAWCWGQNTYGQLGDGTKNDSSKPVKVKRYPGALKGGNDTDVTVGDGHACVINSGSVYCWGSNLRGQLGQGTVEDSLIPVKVTLPDTATQVVATEATTCAVVAGDVYCWGANDYGELGIGVTGRRLVPTKATVIGSTASPSRTVTKIATTPLARSVCAVAASQAYCWGRNSLGQLGDNSTTNRLAPTAVYVGGVLGSKTVVDIAVGGAPSGTYTERAQACAVASGGVYCWGANQFGQLGTGSTSTYSQVPVQVASPVSTGVTAVGVGYGTSCALANGVVYCWGLNDQGQIGDGTTVNRSSPTAVTVANPGLAGKQITRLVAGVNRGCAIAGVSTYCWGRNAEGQIGDGTTVPYRSVPTEAAFLRQAPPPISY